MCYSKKASEKVEKLRTNMHKCVDTVCDHLESNTLDQIPLALKEMENQCNEDFVDVVEDHCQNNNQESTPLLLQELPELRRRICCREQETEGLDQETEGPGALQPGETIYQMVWRSFQSMVQRLKETWQKVWAFVKEKMAPLCSALKAIWHMIESFFSSVAGYFQSTSQASGASQSLVEWQPHLAVL